MSTLAQTPKSCFFSFGPFLAISLSCKRTTGFDNRSCSLLELGLFRFLAFLLVIRIFVLRIYGSIATVFARVRFWTLGVVVRTFALRIRCAFADIGQNRQVMAVI